MGGREGPYHKISDLKIHSLTVNLQQFIDKPSNKGHGIVFARALVKALKVRFPQYGLSKDVNAFANFLDPTIKGLHLKEVNMFNDTVEKLESAASDLSFDVNQPTTAAVTNTQDSEAVDVLSPLEQLKLKFSQAATSDSPESAVKAEVKAYMEFPYCREGDNILQWWKRHQETCPILSRLARHYLAIPASSCKSERVFSCAGNVVSARRTRLSAAKVEMLVVLKQNAALLKEHNKMK